MLQFWQVLSLLMAMVLMMLIYEKGIRPDVSETAVPAEETIEEMIMKEVL